MKSSVLTMDEYPAKRTVSGLSAAKRGSGIAFRDKSNLENRNVQCCNRLGCSIRYNSTQSSIGASDNSKCLKPSISPKSVKKKSGGSKPNSGAPDLRKPRKRSQNVSSCKGTVSAEASSVQIEMEVTEPTPSTSEELEKQRVVSKLEANKRSERKCGQGNQDFSIGSSTKSAAPRNVTKTSKSASHVQGASGSRHGLRNLGCKSTSDSLPSSNSSSMNHARRPDLGTKSSNGERSSARGKIINGSSSRAPSISQRSYPSRPVLSVSERPLSQQAPRRTTHQPPSRDSVASSRTKRMCNSTNRARVSDCDKRCNSTVPEMNLATPQLRQTELQIRGSIPRISSQQSRAEFSTDCNNSYDQPSSSNEIVRYQVTAPTDDGDIHPLSNPSIDGDGFPSINMHGIAEVLLALDRIEQDEEQLWILEAQLFVGGFNLHDQHRDMRLDIDNMTYEELLALEERMGSVSTALTEEALSNCLRRSSYQPISLESEDKSREDYDVKCSICQEEYTEGDEVGKLGCDHLYHLVCIHQWLRQKNWCPICKSSAAPSHSS